MSHHWPIAAATLAATALLWTTRGPALEDLDGANFLLALSDYDLARHQPHFPGYPVYLAACWLAGWLVDPVTALQAPGLLVWPMGLALFHESLRRHFDDPTAWLGWLLLLLCPLGWITAGRTGSDAMGTGLALACASVLAISWRDPQASRLAALAGALGGLTLGVRLAMFPWIGGLAMVALWHPKRRAAVAGFTCGLLLWLVPFCATAGPAVLDHGADFVHGHFTRWGGAITVPESPPVGPRLAAFGKHLVAGLGGPAIAPSGIRIAAGMAWLAALVAGVRHLPTHQWRPLAAVGLPFALWLVLAQNPEKPRHVLPLIPLLALIGAVGLRQLHPKAVALASFALGAVTLQVAHLHTSIPSPEAQLVWWLNSQQEPSEVRLFCGQSERLIVAIHPEFRAEYATDADERDRRLSLGPNPPTLLWTDEFAGWEAAPPGYGPPKKVVDFQRPIDVDPHRPQITVWTAQPL